MMRYLRFLLLSITVFLIPAITYGGVTEVTHPKTGFPVGWENPTKIKYAVDRGSLGKLTNEQARILVEEMMSIWAGVPTAEVGFEFAGYLQEDVTVDNIKDYMDATNCVRDSPILADGVSPIIFDNDGSILEKLTGASSKRIAGLTFLRCFSGSESDPKYIHQGMIIINGRFLDGLGRDDDSPDDLQVNMFGGVILHELGHLLGLGHSDVNADIAEMVSNGSVSEENSKYVPVMYPKGLRRSIAATVLKPDDIATISALYPKGDFVEKSGLVEGSVRNGGVALKGAEVVARRSDDPLCEAVGSLSGSICTPKVNESGGIDFRGDVCGDSDTAGRYRIEGLEAGSYVIEVGAKNPKTFTTIDIEKASELHDLDINISSAFSESKISNQLTSGAAPIVDGSRCRVDSVDYAAIVAGIDEGGSDGSLDMVDADGDGSAAAGCTLLKKRNLIYDLNILIVIVGMSVGVILRFSKLRRFN